MDRFKEIDAFVQVMDHGSLAAAALAEGVTPVMMGRRLDALEQRLGTQLVIRTTRRLTLTDQGASYLDECRQLLARWDEAERAVSSQHQRASGHLIVSAPAAFGRLHVAPHASAFLAANPAVQISFNLTDRVVDLVREGYDLGLRIGGQIDPNFVAIKLATNQRVVCGTPSYFQRRGKPQTLDDLRQHNCKEGNTGVGTFKKTAKPSPSKSRATWTATTANCCTAGSAKAWGWAGVLPGRYKSSCKAANW